MSEAPTPELEPWDEHNRELARHVRPDDWVNPTPADRYHLVVVGGGTAGLVSAAGSAGLGARVALVERNMLGGDCLNVGCVPSKALIRAARAWHDTTTNDRFGAAKPSQSHGDFSKVMERMRRLRAQIGPHDSAARFRDLGIDVFLGDGVFTDPNTVTVGEHKLNFRRAVVATGARASAPPLPGLDGVRYLTNETVFSLTELPKRLAVVGAGPIGCELAQAFARFGSAVTIFDIDERVLPREDPDAAAVVDEALRRDGVVYTPKSTIHGLTPLSGTGVTVEFEDVGGRRSADFDALLIAVGRAPNTDGLGLEAAGVAFDSQRGVDVDDRLRTSNKHIFAAGDVASRYQFTHAADAMARIVIQNALFFGRAKASTLHIPWCTYTSPEVAHIGLYESDARAQGIKVDTFTVAMSEIDRAVLDGETDGFARVHLKQGSDQILGATVVAEHAGDLIGELCLAMTAGNGLGKIAQTIHPYPTQGEVVRKLADAWRRTKLTPTTKRIFDLWFRLFS